MVILLSVKNHQFDALFILNYLVECKEVSGKSSLNATKDNIILCLGVDHVIWANRSLD